MYWDFVAVWYVSRHTRIQNVDVTTLEFPLPLDSGMTHTQSVNDDLIILFTYGNTITMGRQFVQDLKFLCFHLCNKQNLYVLEYDWSER